jgi:hypothetical protein
MLKILIVILKCIFIVVYPKGGLYPNMIRRDWSLADNRRLRNFLTRTAATIKKTEYALSRAFQRIRLSEHKDNFWMILGPLVLSVVTIHSCLMVYRHSIRVSYRQEEDYEHDSPSPNELVSVRGLETEEGRRPQFQNEVDSVRNLAMRAEQRRLTFCKQRPLLGVPSINKLCF